MPFDIYEAATKDQEQNPSSLRDLQVLAYAVRNKVDLATAMELFGSWLGDFIDAEDWQILGWEASECLLTIEQMVELGQYFSGIAEFDPVSFDIGSAMDLIRLTAPTIYRETVEFGDILGEEEGEQ